MQNISFKEISVLTINWRSFSNMKNVVVLAVLLASMCLIQCTSSDSAEAVSCGGTTISFASEVKPIIDAKCATTTACHATGSKEGPGALTTYSQVFASRSQVSSSVSTGKMPQGSTLTADQKNKIVCWIQNGAANN